ncbi:hypothetical protein Tco_0783566 [Tanacetum coccineum]
MEKQKKVIGKTKMGELNLTTIPMIHKPIIKFNLPLNHQIKNFHNYHEQILRHWVTLSQPLFTLKESMDFIINTDRERSSRKTYDNPLNHRIVQTKMLKSSPSKIPIDRVVRLLDINLKCIPFHTTFLAKPPHELLRKQNVVTNLPIWNKRALVGINQLT